MTKNIPLKEGSSPISLHEGILADAELNEASEFKPEIDLITDKTPDQIKGIVEKAEQFPMEKVIARYMDEAEVDPQRAAGHERELKRFLALCAIYHGPIGMRGKVDELWHEFLMFTEDYHRFCDELGGKFIHHIPNSNDMSPGYRRKSALRFNAAYKATFGTEPEENFWPKLQPNAEGVACMGGCGGPCGGCNCAVN